MRKLTLLLFMLFGSLNFISAQDMTFALLTDTHISKNNKAPAQALIEVIKEVNANEAIEFVLVTGDISEEGDFVSLTAAKELLDQLNKPYYVIPGNHETKWTESGMIDFGKIFGYERFKFQHKGVLFLGFNTGPLIRMADGHVAPQDITWLNDELSKAAKNQPVFLVTHYPLLPGDVDNWYEVTDVVRSYNIKSFLGGHYHRNLLFDYDGIPGVINRSTQKDKEGYPGYSLIEIANDSIYVAEKRVSLEPRPWAQLSMVKSYAIEPDASRKPYFGVNSAYPEVKPIWLNRTGVGIYSSPVLYKQSLFVADDLGYLTSYNAKNGKLQWKTQVGHRILGTPDAANDVIVFGSADSFIYGLGTKKGEILWKVKANAPVLGAVTIHNGVAFIGASDGCFRAIDIKTGNLIWNYDKVKGYVETKPLVADGKVIFGAWDNTLYALNEKDGTPEWLWTGGIRGMHFSPAAVWPVAAHGKVFITDPKRAMTAIDITNGKTLWRTAESMVRETVGLSEDQTRVFSKTMNDSIVCYSALSDTPEKIWSSDVGFGYEHAPSMQAEKDGVMYGSTKNGLMFALDGRTGEVLWKHKIGNSLISTLVPINDKEVFFTATGGEVGLLKWKK